MSSARMGAGAGSISQDVRARRALPTTEFAVRRAIAPGLPRRGQILGRASAYCKAVLTGRLPFPDPAETNDRWETGSRLFVAATLARINPVSQELRPVSRLWRGILEGAFATGAYDPAGEVHAHRRLTGATVRGSYLELNNRYTVELLATEIHRIPALELRAYVRWLCTAGAGIRYLGVALNCPQGLRTPGEVDRWLTSWDLVSQYPGWQEHASSVIHWLWRHQMEDNRWDFGARPAASADLPLSDHWRQRSNRKMDWSTRVLSLLSRYYAARIRQ